MKTFLSIASFPIAVLALGLMVYPAIHGSSRALRIRPSGFVEIAPERVELPLAALPTRFRANGGELDASIAYFAREGDVSAMFGDDRFSLFPARPDGSGTRSLLNFTFLDASTSAQVVGIEKEKLGFGEGIRFGAIRYIEPYRGMDLALRTSVGLVEFDLKLRDNADPSAFALRVSGSDRLSLEEDGTVWVDSQGGRVHLVVPTTALVRADGTRIALYSRLRLIDDRTVGIEVPSPSGIADGVDSRPVLIGAAL